MNFLEAVKSGKNFKRPGWDIWYKEIVNYNSGIALTDKENNAIFLNKQDVLADDWIVKEDELAQCPLCGCAVELGEEYPSHEEGLPKPGKVWIKCSNSECIIDIEETLRFTTKEEFIKKWNNRVGKVRND